MKSADIIKAYDARILERRNIEEIWDLIERFIFPFGGQFQGQSGPIDYKKREVYDSTGINANQLLASNIQSSLTNPIAKWANYGFGNSKLQKNQEAMKWRQECEYAVMNDIRTSNYHNEAGEFYLDLTGFATGIQTQEPLEDGQGGLKTIVSDTVPPGECCFDLDLMGFPKNFYRCLKWKAHQIIEKFGKDNVPEKIKKEAESPIESITEHNVIYCVWKRNNGSIDTFSIQPIDKRPYGAKYVLHETKEQLGEETGYYEMPAHMAQWRTLSGSDWGFSPAMIAIWDVLNINEMNEMILAVGAKVLDPALMTTNKGVYGDIDLSSGGLTVVSDMNAMQAFESKARFDVSQMNKADLKQSIRETFYWDQLQLKDSPAMTAYEVQQRIQLMQRLIGPTYGRLQSHYLDPLLERRFKILYRYKKLPPMPGIVQDEGGDLIINYIGPLASAQRMEEIRVIESVLRGVGELESVYPGVTDNIDADVSVRELVTAQGAPAQMLKSTDAVKDIRDKREAQQQEMMELEKAKLAKEGQAENAK